jgi:hypothetical protein
MQRNVKIGVIVLLSLLAGGVAYSVIKYTGTIQTTVNIKGYEIALWRTDTGAAVMTIDWGDLDAGTSETTEEVFAFTEKLTLKNVGDYACYMTWKIDPSYEWARELLTCEFKDGTWQSFPENTFPMSSPIDVGGLWLPIRWTFTVPENYARGPTGFNILLVASTTG